MHSPNGETITGKTLAPAGYSRGGRTGSAHKSKRRKSKMKSKIRKKIRSKSKRKIRTNQHSPDACTASYS
jgi:hypothetical protein